MPTIINQELLYQAEAIKDIQHRLPETRTWFCTEVLLYMVDENEFKKAKGVWTFPSDAHRSITSTSECGDVEDYFVYVRLEGRKRFDKVLFGMCRKNAGGLEQIVLPPIKSQLVRIISIEKEGDPLRSINDFRTSLSNAQHVQNLATKYRDVGRGQDSLTGSKHVVIRTSEYLAANEAMKNDQGDFNANYTVMEDQLSTPWKLAKKLEDVGLVLVDRVDKPNASLPSGGKALVYDNIWLVEETMSCSSNEFLMTGRWVVENSIDGNGSICAKLWDAAIVEDDQTSSCHKVQLICMT